MDMNDPAYLKLSVLGAMLGEVTGNLAALTAGLDGRRVRLVAYFFEEPIEADRESVECMATKVIADYTDKFAVETAFHALSDGNPRMVDFWAFVRAGVQVS